MVTGYAVASLVFAFEAIFAATNAISGEEGFTLTMLAAAWVGFTPSMLVFGIVVASIFLTIVRARGWPRPASDVVGGAVLAMAAPYAASLTLDVWAAFNGQSVDLDAVFAEAAAVGGVGAVFAMFPGAFGGYAYWHFAGRPEPPYGLADSDAHGPRAALDDNI